MNVLFIGGGDFTHYNNHRAHHFIAFLENHVTQVDIVSLTKFYSDPRPAGLWTRLRCGLRDSLRRRVTVVEKKTGIHVDIRKLPSRLDPVAQDLWAYLNLGLLAGRRYDLCIFGNPDNVLLALLLRKKGVVETLIYDDWDYYPGFDRPLYWRLFMKWRERICMSIADVVISVGSLLADLRRDQGATRTFVIPNGVDYHCFARAQQKRPHPPTLVYMGTLAEEYGIDVSIKGFIQVRKEIPTARYLVIGFEKGEYGRYLHSLVDELKLSDSVFFLGQKQYEELPCFLAEADIGVALFRPNELMTYTFPLKVVEYMAAGLAVVGTKIGETERMILEAKSGEAVECSPKEFASAVIGILNDRARLMKDGENAKEYARRYDWNTLFTGLFSIIGIEAPMVVCSRDDHMPGPLEARRGLPGEPPIRDYTTVATRCTRVSNGS